MGGSRFGSARSWRTWPGSPPGSGRSTWAAGPGALTASSSPPGSGRVTAVDPSASFVAAAREVPGVASAAPRPRSCRSPSAPSTPPGPARRALHGGPGRGAARDGPRDPARRRRRGLRVGSRGRAGPAERVLAGGARRSTPTRRDESDLAGAREGHLAELFAQAGLGDARAVARSPCAVEHATFDEWWEPFTLGVGPAGAHVPRLARRRARRAARRSAASGSRARRSR